MKLLLPRNGEIHRSLCPLIPWVPKEKSSLPCTIWTPTTPWISIPPIECDFHGLNYRITGMGQMLIGLGNRRLLDENGTFDSIERWWEERYGLGQNLPEWNMEISWPTIKHSIKSRI
jgi:hypothetical protein